MATKLILKSLELFQFIQNSIFRRKSYISFDPVSQKLYVLKKPVSIFECLISASINLLNLLLGFIFAGFMIFGNIDIKRLLHEHADQVFVTCFAQLLCGVAFGFDLCIYNYGSDFVIYLNILFKFLPHPSLVSGKSQMTWNKDLIGCLGIIMVVLISCVGTLITIISGLQILKCSMLPLAINYIFPPENTRSYVFFLVEFGISMMFHWELCLEVLTAINIICTLLIYGVLTHLAHLKTLHRLTVKYSHGRTFLPLLKIYRKLLVLHSLILEPGSAVIATIMGFGFYILIFSICLSIYGWGIISPLFYPVVPFVGLVCIIILVVSLPMAPLSIQMSKHLLQRWNYMPEKFDGGKKYLTRLFKSLRPTEFTCGKVGVLNRARSTIYVASIMENCMTCLLLLGTVVHEYV